MQRGPGMRAFPTIHDTMQTRLPPAEHSFRVTDTELRTQVIDQAGARSYGPDAWACHLHFVHVNPGCSPRPSEKHVLRLQVHVTWQNLYECI